jgi:hypothetical protein
MESFDLTVPTDSFVLHFGSEEHQINAITFTNSIRSLTEAMMEINRVVNQYEEIDIVIEAIGGGSFRTKIKTVRKHTGELIKIGAKHLVLPILSIILAEKALHPDFNQHIKIREDEVIITQEESEIKVSRDAYAAGQKVANNEIISSSLSNAFSALSRDDKISNFGISLDLKEQQLAIEIKREEFPIIQNRFVVEEAIENGKHETVQANLFILKTVFERGSRKWQFVWNGHKISAPIKDETFFDKIESREYKFGQGDYLVVEMTIYKEKDEVSGAMINKSYEINRVMELKKKSSQLKLIEKD